MFFSNLVTFLYESWNKLPYPLFIKGSWQKRTHNIVWTHSVILQVFKKIILGVFILFYSGKSFRAVYYICKQKRYSSNCNSKKTEWRNPDFRLEYKR